VESCGGACLRLGASARKPTWPRGRLRRRDRS